MSIIPDYALQATELMRQLEGQAELTAQYWSDGKRREYYDQYIQEYLDYLDQYVYGGSKMKGKGLNDLLEFIARKTDEFERIAESSITSCIIVPECLSGNGAAQILAPTQTSEWNLNVDLRSVRDSRHDVPTEQAPDQITESRSTYTIDDALNGPGNLSARNLRDILNKRNNG